MLATLRTRCGCERKLEVPSDFREVVIPIRTVLNPLNIFGEPTNPVSVGISTRRFRRMWDREDGVVFEEVTE
jgi:hypothetical protein